MDAGPIYTVKNHRLKGTETKPELYQILAEIGAQQLIDTLPRILDGSLQPVAQDDSVATYCSLLDKTDALINSAELTAAQAERRIRAHRGFPKSKITYGDTTLTITKSHVATTPQSNLDTKCRDENYLIVDELIAPSGRTMSAQDYLRGYAA